MPPLSYIFWILMLLWFVGGVFWCWPAAERGSRAAVFGILFLLLVTVGMKIFR
jgi:hypothetical protein